MQYVLNAYKWFCLVLGIYNFGEGQKVVAFSFYGDPDSKRHDVRQYFNGIKLNLDAIKRFYPGQVYSFAEKVLGQIYIP